MRTSLVLRALCLTLVTALVPSTGCDKSETQAMNHPSDNDHHDHGEHQGAHDEHHGDEGHGDNGHGDKGHGDNGHGYKGHRFDDPAKWTAHFESPERTAWQKPDEVVAALAPAADAKIADIGAGTGYFALRFAAAAPEGQVYAVDIEPAMVEWLAKRATDEGHANMVAVQGESADPKLPEAVDLVFMCNVFHHLADPEAYFAKVGEQLRPDARVVILDFRKDNPEDAPGPPAQMRMRSAQIQAAMEAAGYELVREDRELLEYQYLLEFKAASRP